MKKIMQRTIIVSITLLLSACGGGTDKSTFDTGQEQITISTCPTTVEALSNDLLIKDSSDTIIEYTFDSNGTKQICVVSGSAHIIREN